MHVQGAVAAQQPQPLLHEHGIDPLGAVALLVVVTFAAAVCATGGKSSAAKEDHLRRSINERDRLNTADTVGMESNVLYTMAQNAKAGQSPARPTSRQTPPTVAEEDMDEDELANAQMEHNLEHYRALSMKGRRPTNIGSAGAATATATSASATSQDQVTFASDEPKWLHHNLTKRDAIEKLRTFTRQHEHGSLFLVRVKNDAKSMYALDLLWTPHGATEPVIEHFLISRAATGAMEFDGVLLRSGAARTLEAVVAELHGHTQFLQQPLAEFVPAEGESAVRQPRSRRGSDELHLPHRAELAADDDNLAV